MTGDNPDTYGWYQCDEETYDSGTPPEEQMATEPVRSDETEALLAEYRAGCKEAQTIWDEYLETESPKAFARLLAISRKLSAMFVELASTGMTLEEIKGE